MDMKSMLKKGPGLSTSTFSSRAPAARHTAENGHQPTPKSTTGSGTRLRSSRESTPSNDQNKLSPRHKPPSQQTRKTPPRSTTGLSQARSTTPVSDSSRKTGRGKKVVSPLPPESHPSPKHQATTNSSKPAQGQSGSGRVATGTASGIPKASRIPTMSKIPTPSKSKMPPAKHT